MIWSFPIKTQVTRGDSKVFRTLKKSVDFYLGVEGIVVRKALFICLLLVINTNEGST